MSGPVHALGRALAPALGVAAWTAYWRRRYAVRPTADELHWAHNADGWRLALWRWRPQGPQRRRHPVLLLHGLAAGRVGWDLDPSRSLARHLQGLGFEVWALELRGHGDSDRPQPGTRRRWGWTADDYLLGDVPAALELIRQRSQVEQVHWVGHSMGGILLYAHLARGRGGVRSGVAVASALDYSQAPSDFHALVRLLGLARVLPALPLGPLATATAPLAGRFHTRAEEFNLWPPNLEPGLIRRLHGAAFHPVSSGVLIQLASAFQPGGLRDAQGAVRYRDGLPAVTVPVLALAGTKDRQCAPEAAAATLDALGGPRRLAVFGREHGQPEHYGHFDLLVGRRAPQETWPVLSDWLLAHDA